MKIDILVEKLNIRLKSQTSVETQRFYSYSISFVNQYLVEGLKYSDLDELTEDDVHSFINSMIELGYKPKTINNFVEVIKKLVRINKGSSSEHMAILEIKPRRNEPEPYMPLSVAELDQFIKWVKDIPTETSDRNLKKKCMFLLAIQNGIRSNEMLELRVKDVMIDDNRIRLSHTKNGVVRYAYFNEYTKELLQEYIKRRNPQIYLFENRVTHDKMTQNSYCDVFDYASQQCGIHVTSHILRATFATHALRNGCNIESVRIMMGHSNLKTTQMYLHMTDEEILEDNQNYNPLAKYDSTHGAEMN